MADVGAEERAEARPERVRLLVEGPRVDRIVRLAAEVEAADVEIEEVLLARDLAARVVVEVGNVAGAVAVVVESLAAAHGVHDARCRVLLGELEEGFSVEARGIRVLEGVQLPLLPVPDEIGEQRAGPTHAAFQEGEVELGETARDTAEEQGFGHGLAGRGE